MSQDDDIIVEENGAITTVRLNRPHRKNAITYDMWDRLAGIFSSIDANRNARVMILTGTGDSFCSGADIGNVQRALDGAAQIEVMRSVSRAVLTLHRMAKPTLARVAGVAVGGGWNLALACDLVIAGESARFCQIYSQRGLSPDVGGSWILPRLVGPQKAKELTYLAPFLSAAEAEKLGLVNLVVPDAELDDVVDDWTGRLASGPPVALSLTKSLLDQAITIGIEQALDAEFGARMVNFATGDTAEGYAAFTERRLPRFLGR